MSEQRGPGTICTFYSYKGGVGRSLALANVATLLAKWGHRVLCVDWDLEAPGLHHYFDGRLSDELRGGVVELVEQLAAGRMPGLSEHVTEVEIEDAHGRLDLMPAGRPDAGYVKRVQALDWARLYAEEGLGAAVEELRAVWKERYDFVLIDSRTGISDVGGICTVQLPDLLVFCFTPNRQSLEGSLDVVQRAHAQRSHLPFERGRVPCLPVITRFEATIEVDLARQWMSIFQERLAPTMADWLHRDVRPAEVLPHLRVPHIAHWSFGERLPVLEEGTSDPLGIGYSFETLAAVVASRLDGSEMLVANRQSYVDAAVNRARSRDGVTALYDFDLFLSYSHADLDFAKELGTSLRAFGINVALDPAGAPDDATLHGAGGPARSRNMALIIGVDGPSPTAWTDHEMRRFVLSRVANEDVPRLLIPILRGDPKNVPSFARELQLLDARGETASAVAAAVAVSVLHQLTATRAAELGADHPATVTMSGQFVRALVATGELDRARELQVRRIEQIEIAEGSASLAAAEASQLLATIEELRGRTDVAAEIWQSQYSLLITLSGAIAPETLEVGVRWATALQELGRLEQAEELLHTLHSNAFDCREPEPQWSVAGRLASVLADRGTFDEALAVQRHLLEDIADVAGTEHPSTLAGRAAYARLLARSGHYTEATALQKWLAEHWLQHLGPEHPTTLTARTDLAETLERQGDYEAALEIRGEVLEAYSDDSGQLRPEMLAATQAYALTLANAGRPDEARSFQGQLLALTERELGPENPATLQALEDLGATLLRLGIDEEAQTVLQTLVGRTTRHFGADHPRTLDALSQLALLLFDRGRFYDAEKIARQVVTARLSQQGEDHPSTLTAMTNLAAIVDAQGDYEESRTLATRVLNEYRRTFGDEHPTTLEAMDRLSRTLINLGEIVAAESLLREVYEDRRRVLGEDHPKSIDALISLAEAVARAERLPEAVDLLSQAQASRSRTHGPDHPDTLRVQARLGRALSQVGRVSEARRLLEDTAARLADIVGDDHPDTIDAYWDLQRALVLSGHAEQARPILQHVVDARRRIYGQNHSATVAAMSALADVLHQLGETEAAVRLTRQIGAASRTDRM